MFAQQIYVLVSLSIVGEEKASVVNTHILYLIKKFTKFTFSTVLLPNCATNWLGCNIQNRHFVYHHLNPNIKELQSE